MFELSPKLVYLTIEGVSDVKLTDRELIDCVTNDFPGAIVVKVVDCEPQLGGYLYHVQIAMRQDQLLMR